MFVLFVTAKLSIKFTSCKDIAEKSIFMVDIVARKIAKGKYNVS